MKKSQAEATTAKNLEAKFDRGEEVLDYFDVRKARLVAPAKGSAVKAKFAYPAKRNSQRRAVVREKSGSYGKKKKQGVSPTADFRLLTFDLWSCSPFRLLISDLQSSTSHFSFRVSLPLPAWLATGDCRSDRMRVARVRVRIAEKRRK